ncbi:MAG: biosynthetic arginine decarboxylase, partial [Gammaproteobacteria bacterium]
IPELLSVVRHIGSADLRDAMVLLHFHLGSQLADIQTLKNAVKEIVQVYAQLAKRDIPIRYLDVGGGLGVNYDADYVGDEEGINYTLQEYANAVVYTVKEVCDAENIVHPILTTESGRAITAHHSVLIVETLGAYRKDEIDQDFRPGPKDHPVVRELYRILATVPGNGHELKLSELLEAYHDAIEKRKESDALFSLGYFTIEEKALTEQLYWSACRAIHTAVERLAPEHLPVELALLADHLVEQYLCDFSVFQSMLDHWAIGQRFPIVPISRLDERPRVRGVLVDLTCDSDGKVSRYVSSENDKDFLPLHEIENGEPYFIGIFLMGAYQDIMGDTHNLFGRVAEVHVYADEEEAEGYYIEKVIPGMSIEQMLALVQYFPNDLQRRMNKSIREKTLQGTIRPKQGVELLEQYTRLFTESTYYKREI